MKLSDISIIVQGPYEKRPSELTAGGEHTADCIAAIRSRFKESKIIFSTWKNPPQATAALCDQIILNDDPGSLLPNSHGKNFLANFNRQLVTTRTGLAAAITPYALKIRSDSWLTGSGFCDLFDRMESEPKSSKSLFQCPLLVCALGCVDPVVWPSVYHLTDLFHFGKTADMRDLWSLPFCPVEFANWHNSSNVPRWRRGGEGLRPERLAPEQYLHAGWLAQRCGSIDIPDAILGGSKGSYQRSELSFLRNFRAFPSEMLGFMLPERLRMYDHTRHFSYRNDWRKIKMLQSEADFEHYIMSRYPQFLASKLQWFLKQKLRPILGRKVRNRIKSVFFQHENSLRNNLRN